jgi:two-component system, cell cycle sensor histidine kinase and response regulator CckA
VTDDYASTPLLAGQSVLVVDDVGVVRRTVFRFLSEAGFRVFEAASAGEALEVLSTARPPVNLLITDVIMPDVNGVDLARLVREQWPTTRFLFMSAYPAEVLAREGLDDLAVVFLAKPFTREEIVAKVRAALQGQPKTDGEESRSRRPAG